jgi:hypothetical protein
MWLLLLEALAALGLLVFLVWWTMFSGRQRGERRKTPPAGRPSGEGPHPGAPPQDGGRRPG